MTTEFTLFHIYNPVTLEYYKGGSRWVSNIDKAKLYKRIGDAKNAINCFEEFQTFSYGRTPEQRYNPKRFVIFEYQVRFEKNRVATYTWTETDDSKVD